MSSNPRSRWANAQEDEAVEAERKRQKEERRQRKAAKARKAEEEEEARRRKHSLGSTEDRPTKRQRRTPEPDLPPAKPLRFEVEGWNKSRSVEHYDKLNDIEEGTYGWVARATELATGKVVALKRLKLEAGDRSGLPVTGLREIQILRDCKHRNIVSMDEVVVGDNVSRLDNSIFLVLEFVEHDLKGILDDMPEPFLSSEVKQLLLQLTSGVAYLHNHWILHRDLKTSNILLNNRGQLKIADFGMARYVGDPLPNSPPSSSPSGTEAQSFSWAQRPTAVP
uniref:cyclin-dependent kinase n=1 Tax=Bionectria ochroleuca TaxID=29856 RepID=A0A8H7KC67_BIOOC